MCVWAGRVGFFFKVHPVPRSFAFVSLEFYRIKLYSDDRQRMRRGGDVISEDCVRFGTWPTR